MKLQALPQNYEAEAEILGSILKDNNNILEAFEILNDTDFHRDGHRHVYNAMLELYKEDSIIDIITLSTKLRPLLEAIGGLTYITELYDSATGRNIKNHCEIVKEESNKRQIIKSCNRALESAHKHGNCAKKIIEEFENSILDIGKEKNIIISSAKLMEIALGSIEKNYRNGGGLIGMKCKINAIDNAIDGFVKKQLYILAGRPSMGKTLLAMQIAYGLSEKNKVVLFELEMSEEELGVRQLSSESKINGVKLRRGDLQDKEWESAANAASTLSQNNLFVDTSSSQSIYDIRNKCKKMKLTHGLDCIIIDHLGILDGNRKISQDNRNLLIGEITRQAKIMAKDLDINVILLSQLSRAVEQRADKRPMMSDLRESGNIEQDADLVLFVYRDEYYNPDTKYKNTMELIIGKQRNGKTGVLKLHCDLGTQTIRDLSA